ncbi:hypothetical protein [Chitinophaga qingshengii]|uniref:Uncharacterized protein n=1 Tax=Chitinophaga qingshengii TaxID=1569794 RepID=A0ABR7TWM4_9BACT|nr:hypothetical protein [Chitinophaga qingshengii]MBC9934832.1 hypothetical protein [Chitinophaga qingshengii]
MKAKSSNVFVKTAGTATVAAVTKTKIALHFRRHPDWTGYMNLANDNAEMEYGFDWLGDSDFDFEKAPNTQPAAHKTDSRYEFIEKHSYNPSLDISQTGSVETVNTDMCDIKEDVTFTLKNVPAGTPKTTTAPATSNTNDGHSSISTTSSTTTVRGTVNSAYLEEHKRIRGLNNIAGDVSNLKNEYQKGAALTVLGGNKYYPAYLNVRYNKTIKIIAGIRHLDNPVTTHFGDNNDEIHLVPKAGSENKFSIIPNKITKAELAAGPVEITITNITASLAADTAILAYHIDSDTPKDKNGNPVIVANANRVGELIVLANKKYYMAECMLIKVKRASTAATPTQPAVVHTDFTTGTNNFSTYDRTKIEKTLSRILAQANIATTITDKELLNYSGPDVTSNESSFTEKTLKAYLEQEVPVNVTGAARTTAINNLKNARTVYIFLHDYKMNASGNGLSILAFAPREPYPQPKRGYANAAMVFGNADAASLVHELVHSMGCDHTFISIEKDRVSFGGPNNATMNAVYFQQRSKDQFHIFQKGRTENLMDYSYGWMYDGNITTMAAINPSSSSSGGPYATYLWEQKHKCYKAAPSFYRNPNTLVGLFKWQWKVMRTDDELIVKTEPV